MNNAELKTSLQAIWELQQNKEAFSIVKDGLDYKSVSNESINERLAKKFEGSNIGMVFPKILIDAKLIENNLDPEAGNSSKTHSFIDLDDETLRILNCAQDKTGSNIDPTSVEISNLDWLLSNNLSDTDVANYKEQFIKMYLELENNYRLIKSEYTAIREEEKKLEELKENFQHQIDDLNEKILSNDIIHAKYVHLIPSIIDIIDERRAENFTDALNLAIREEKEELYRSEQLEIEREKLEELQRKNDIAEEETAARNKILKSDLEQQRRIMEQHNREMEYYAERQADAAKQQAKAVEKQAQEIERANREAKQNERERQRKLYAASLAYDSAARRAALASENDKAWREAQKESAYAEMQKYK